MMSTHLEIIQKFSSRNGTGRDATLQVSLFRWLAGGWEVIFLVFLAVIDVPMSYGNFKLIGN
jgi:hypothetical protein